jgi:Tfp pilus assembly protein PilX
MVRPRIRVQKCVPAQRRAQGGFVLVSVLWVLVIMVLAASTFSLWVDKSREQAMERRRGLAG